MRLLLPFKMQEFFATYFKKPTTSVVIENQKENENAVDDKEQAEEGDEGKLVTVVAVIANDNFLIDNTDNDDLEEE